MSTLADLSDMLDYQAEVYGMSGGTLYLSAIIACFQHPEWARAIYEQMLKLAGGELPPGVVAEADRVVRDFPMSSIEEVPR